MTKRVIRVHRFGTAFSSLPRIARVLAALLFCGTFGLPAVLTRAADAPTTRTVVKDLPAHPEMPDPLIFNDGTKVTTPEQWRKRREEMKTILEEYEYGHMPPPPDNVKGKEISSTAVMNGALLFRKIHLTFGPQEKLGFDIGIFTPQQPKPETKPATQLSTQPARQLVDDPPARKPPFPTIVSLTFAVNENAARQYAEALRRGYAVVIIGYQQLGADNKNYRQTGFFPAYPDYDWNDISAWAWGLSRCVDYLQDEPAVDKNKLVATGTSRLGQAVLLAGAFDERISLVAPVAGGMAMRYSGKSRGGGQGIDEVEDQNTYWFGPRFEEFKGQTDKLPCDQHWLLALAAPRPYILCNSLADQYGNPNAAVQTYLFAKPVYTFLGVPDLLGLNFRPGTHGMQTADWNAILDFADEKLLKKPSTRRFDVLPTPEQLKR